MMLSGVPNYFLSFGYTNASWTLRSDVTAKAVCRLLNRMKAGGYDVCTPRLPDEGMERLPVISFHLRLRPARARLPPEAGLAPAVDRPAELREGSLRHALQPGRRGPGAKPQRNDSSRVMLRRAP